MTKDEARERVADAKQARAAGNDALADSLLYQVRVELLGQDRRGELGVAAPGDEHLVRRP